MSGNRLTEEKQRLVLSYLQGHPEDKSLAVLKGDAATARGRRTQLHALATWHPAWATLYEPGDGVPGDALFPAGAGALADGARDGTRSAGEPMASGPASRPYPLGFPMSPCIAERAGGQRKVLSVGDFHAGKKAEDTTAMAAALRAQVPVWKESGAISSSPCVEGVACHFHASRCGEDEGLSQSQKAFFDSSALRRRVCRPQRTRTAR